MDSIRTFLFTRFCAAAADHLELGLNTEQLIGLYNELIASAKITGDTSIEMSLYVTLATKLMELNEHKKVILYVEEGIRLLKETRISPMDIIRTFLFTRFCAAAADHLELGLNTEQLIGLYNELIASAKNTGDTSIEISSYLILVAKLVELDEYQKVILYAEKCMRLAQETGNQHAEMRSYSRLGQAYNSLQQYDNAILHIEKCIDIAKETGDQHSEMTSYLILGHAYYSLQQYDDAILHIEKCIDIAKETGDQPVEMLAYHILGDAYKSLQQYDNAILYSKKCIVIAKETGEQRAEMMAYSAMGTAYFSMSQFENALRFIRKGLKIAEIHGNNDDIEKASDFLPVIYQSLNMDDKSLKLPHKLEDAGCSPGKDEREDYKTLKDNLDQARMTNNVIATFNALDELSLYHRSKREYDMAIECHKETFALDAGPLNDLKNAIYFFKIARLYKKLGRDDEALQHYHDALACAIKCNDKVYQSYCCEGLGDIYFSRRERNKAKEFYAQGVECCEYIFDRLSEDEHQINIVDKYVKFYKLISLLHLLDGKVEEALLFAERCRARALRQRLITAHGIKQEEADKDYQLQYSDVISTRTYSILFYTLFLDVAMSIILIQMGKISAYPIAKIDKNEMKSLINECYGEIGVTKMFNCENRSLNTTPVSREDQLLPLSSSTLHRSENVKRKQSEITDESAVSKRQKTSDATCASSARK